MTEPLRNPCVLHDGSSLWLCDGITPVRKLTPHEYARLKHYHDVAATLERRTLAVLNEQKAFVATLPRERPLD